MRLLHFETLKPICPRCRIEQELCVPLHIAIVEQEENDNILDGSLVCSNNYCQAEYPIIDGIPILIHPIHEFLKNNLHQINARDNLSLTTESMLGDASGSGSEFNNMRYQLSIYAWDHYGDKTKQETQLSETFPASHGNAHACLIAGIDLLNAPITAPILDIGCAVGRSSFELVQTTGQLTLGIDYNFSALRLAQSILQKGKARFPLRHLGVIFDHIEVNTQFANNELVDFWACDATALPFMDNTFNFISALNVFDIVSVPRMFIQQLKQKLNRKGKIILSTPYDWSSSLAMHQWVGGYNQRSVFEGESEVLIKQLLQQQLQDTGESLNLIDEIQHHPWHIRLHSRNVSSFDVHILACEKY